MRQLPYQKSANCHIKNRPTATSKLDENTDFLEIIRIFAPQLMTI